jgi:ATP-dependent RNA helicase DeaD
MFYAFYWIFNHRSCDAFLGGPSGGSDELCEALNTRGYSIEGLNGILTSRSGTVCTGIFGKGQRRYGLATEWRPWVDIAGVTQVYILIFPKYGSYVHRIGRYGPAGKRACVNISSPREMGQLRQIERE